MPVPPSVTKINKHGVTFVSNVDRVKYTINELTRAALKDCAKLIRKRMIEKLKDLPGMKRSRRKYSGTQYWVRRQEADLQIGFRHDTWYSAGSELGDRNQPARGILRNTVLENIDEMRIIQGRYLTAVEDENRARGLIDEREELSSDDDA